MTFDWLKTRQAKHGSYAAVYTVVLIAILTAANYLGIQYNETFDATENKLYSLSDQTLKILDNLEGDLKIYYFDQTAQFGGARSMLVRYENAASKVTVDYVDPDSKIELTRAMGVDTYGTLLVEYAGNREEANSTSEQDITNAIIKALKREEKTACFLTGHGEAGLDDSDRFGFSLAKESTEKANYATRSVSLLEQPEIPGDCTLIVIAGPEKAYFEPEIDVIRDYVESGGRAAILIDHQSSPELVKLAASWGVKVHDDIVVDLSGIGQFFGRGPLSPVVTGYKSHPIAEAMVGTATFFPMTRGVEIGDDVEGWSVEELFSTTNNSFATEEFDPEAEELKRVPDKERPGPITLAAAATYAVPAVEPSSDAGGEGESVPSGDVPAEGAEGEAKITGLAAEDEKTEGRIVVVGTSWFARNTFIGGVGNEDLYLNMLNWLSSDEDLMSIRPNDPQSTPMNLSSSQMKGVFWLTVVGLPLAVILTGVRVWWVRR